MEMCEYVGCSRPHNSSRRWRPDASRVVGCCMELLALNHRHAISPPLYYGCAIPHRRHPLSPPYPGEPGSSGDPLREPPSRIGFAHE
ncbi:hypothetical protein GW17_00011574 [Ensete ventricosum]|nr:hypothetical protein GW17_00011574 [Ensete ventricosum]